MSKTYERVVKYINKGKEPKGHCEAMEQRHNKSLEIADKTFKKELKGK